MYSFYANLLILTTISILITIQIPLSIAFDKLEDLDNNMLRNKTSTIKRDTIFQSDKRISQREKKSYL